MQLSNPADDPGQDFALAPLRGSASFAALKKKTTLKNKLKGTLSSDSLKPTNQSGETCTCASNAGERKTSRRHQEPGPCTVCGKNKPAEKSKQRLSFLKEKVKSSGALGPSPLAAQVSRDDECTRCYQETNENTSILIENKRFHYECLQCSSCRTKLSSSVFSYKDSTFCRKCYFNESGFMCEVCERPILKEYLILNNKKIHSTCKRCNVCTIN